MSQQEKTPQGWIEVSLGDVIELKYGKALPAKIRDGVHFPVYGSNGIVGYHSKPIVNRPALIIGRKGSIGEVHLSEEDCSPIDTTYFVDEFHGQPPSFWLHRLLCLNLADLNRATALPGLNRNDAYQLTLLLPPLKEQYRIVEKTEALQARSSKARKTLDAIPPLLEKFRQSVLSSAFRGDLTAVWRAQNPDIEPAEKLLERIRKKRRKRWEESELAKMKTKGKIPKDDKWKKKYKEPEPVDPTGLPKLPVGWCWVALEELSEKVTDGTHQPPPFTSSGIPFLVIRNIIKGMVDWEGVFKWVTESTYDKFTSNCKPEKGDVLYSAVGSYGVAVEVLTDRAFMFQRHIAHIKPVRNVVSPRYITLSLNSPSSLDQAHKVARGVAQKTVTLTYLRRFNLALPPEKEQHEIIKRVNKALHLSENIKTSVEESLSQAELLDQSILAKAFRGELVPQDPNDEPASQLMKRIKQEKASLEALRKQRGKSGRKKVIRKKEASAISSVRLETCSN